MLLSFGDLPAVTCVVLEEVRSHEAGKAGRLLKRMRNLEGFLARSKIICIRKLVTAACGLEEARDWRLCAEGCERGLPRPVQ